MTQRCARVDTASAQPLVLTQRPPALHMDCHPPGELGVARDNSDLSISKPFYYPFYSSTASLPALRKFSTRSTEVLYPFYGPRELITLLRRHHSTIVYCARLMYRHARRSDTSTEDCVRHQTVFSLLESPVIPAPVIQKRQNAAPWRQKFPRPTGSGGSHPT